ncbi:MAG: 6-phosphogluconate dehydrogenase [Phycisphaerales bacterium]|nr:6-phosphogluconate dehydrogenase [Phycisphaerales bacterium]
MINPACIIGLGNLGLPMARNLLAAKFQLSVYNRTPEKALPLVEQGARLAGSAAEAARGSVFIITIVSDDRALESIVDDAFLSACLPGAIHLSMSTILPATAEKLAAMHAKHRIDYVAAPVFGRPEAAAAKKLWICTSGPEKAKKAAKIVFDALGQGVFDFGEAPGAASVVKLAGNFLLTAAIEAMGEAAALAEKNGVPRAALLNMLTSTLFNCPIYNNYAARIIAADFDKVGFTARLALKDMRLALDTATASDTPMPILSLLRDRYLAAIANNQGHLDASALALRPALDAGLNWMPQKP